MIFCTFAMHKISWQNIKDLLYKNIVHTYFVIKEIDFLFKPSAVPLRNRYGISSPSILLANAR